MLQLTNFVTRNQAGIYLLGENVELNSTRICVFIQKFNNNENILTKVSDFLLYLKYVIMKVRKVHGNSVSDNTCNVCYILKYLAHVITSINSVIFGAIYGTLLKISLKYSP